MANSLTIDELKRLAREVEKVEPWRAWVRKIGERNFSLQESAYLPVDGDGYVLDNRTTLGTILVVVPSGHLAHWRTLGLPDHMIAASIAWKKLG